MAQFSRSRLFLSLFALSVTAILPTTPFLPVERAEAISLIDLIRTHPRLVKANSWASSTNVLDSLDIGQYGDKVTLVLPNNAAFERFERQFPLRRKRLLSREEDMETVSRHLRCRCGNGSKFCRAAESSLGKTITKLSRLRDVIIAQTATKAACVPSARLSGRDAMVLPERQLPSLSFLTAASLFSFLLPPEDEL